MPKKWFQVYFNMLAIPNMQTPKLWLTYIYTRLFSDSYFHYIISTGSFTVMTTSIKKNNKKILTHSGTQLPKSGRELRGEGSTLGVCVWWEMVISFEMHCAISWALHRLTLKSHPFHQHQLWLLKPFLTWTEILSLKESGWLALTHLTLFTFGFWEEMQP